MSGIITRRLAELAALLEVTPHAEKTAVCERAARELNMSLPTLYRKLKPLRAGAARKRRDDAGISALSRDEAQAIASVLIESARSNDKRLYSLMDAADALRNSGMILAGRVDEGTGEFFPMSGSAIRRAMCNYGLHPDTLLQPAPVTELASRHPNHVWQIDASLCVLYYLRRGEGLRVAEHNQFYKNKPRNLASIAADRVWSYEITDHYTGWIYVQYVMGAESSENLCSVLIEAMQERGNGDVLHGVPSILMLDPGSANTSAMAKNLCRSLGIDMIVHAPGNARVTGQVENARNIIERKLEAGLKFQPVDDLDALNDLARRWRVAFNASAIHSRHRRTRSELWLTIQQDQLIKAPPVDVCRAQAVAEPVSRRVTPKLRISYEGRDYDVRHVPDVLVGDTLMITRNPWRSDSVQVHGTGADGRPVFYLAEAVQVNEAGFALDAAIIGEQFRALPETQAQRDKQAAEQLAMGTGNAEETAAARKAKAIPFDGKLQPYKAIDDIQLPTYLPKRGVEHELRATVETPPISVSAIAKRLLPRIEGWSAEHYAWLSRHYPAGAPEEQLDEVEAALRAAFTRRPSLTVIGGGAA